MMCLFNLNWNQNQICYVNKVNCIRNFILFACIYETIFHKLRALLLLLTFYSLLVGIHLEPFKVALLAKSKI